jgi:hypothetical protein
MTCPANAYEVEVGENGLRDPVKGGLAGVFRTQQTQLSTSGLSPVAGFPAWIETGSRPGAAAAKVAPLPRTSS